MPEREKVSAEEYDKMLAASRRDPATGRFTKAEAPAEAPTEDPFIAAFRDEGLPPEEVEPPPPEPPEEQEPAAGDVVGGLLGGVASGAQAGMAAGPLGMAAGAAGGAAVGWLLGQASKPTEIGTLEGGPAQQQGDDTLRQLLDVTKQMARVGTPIKGAVKTTAQGSRM